MSLCHVLVYATMLLCLPRVVLVFMLGCSVLHHVVVSTECTVGWWRGLCHDLHCCPVLALTTLSINSQQLVPQAVPEPCHYRITSTYTMLLLQGIGSGHRQLIASLVLRSMLKQRRILMRMH